MISNFIQLRRFGNHRLDTNNRISIQNVTIAPTSTRGFAEKVENNVGAANTGINPNVDVSGLSGSLNTRVPAEGSLPDTTLPRKVTPVTGPSKTSPFPPMPISFNPPPIGGGVDN